MQAEDLLTLALYIPRRFFFTSFKKRLQPVCNQFYSRRVWCVAVVNWDWIRKSARSVFKIQIVDPSNEKTHKSTRICTQPETHRIAITKQYKLWNWTNPSLLCYKQRRVMNVYCTSKTAMRFGSEKVRNSKNISRYVLIENLAILHVATFKGLCELISLHIY